MADHSAPSQAEPELPDYQWNTTSASGSTNSLISPLEEVLLVVVLKPVTWPSVASAVLHDDHDVCNKT